MPAHYNLRREKPKNVMSEYAKGGKVGLKNRKKPKPKKGMDTPALQKAYAKQAQKKDPYQDMRNFERERNERRAMATEDKNAPTFEKSDTKTETATILKKVNIAKDMRKFEREREEKASKRPVLRYNKKKQKNFTKAQMIAQLVRKNKGTKKELEKKMTSEIRKMFNKLH